MTATMDLKYFSLWHKGFTAQCRRCAVANIYYCWHSVAERILLGHHHIQEIHKDRYTPHLDTASNRRSHQHNFLLNFLNVHLSWTQANPLKTQATYFPGGPLSAHQAKHQISCSTMETLSTLSKPSHWQDLTWLSGQKTPCSPLEKHQGPLQAIK